MKGEFFACFSREVREANGEERIGLEFEVVESSSLSCFLDNQPGERMMSSKKYSDIWGAFRATDERFREIKDEYLGKTGFSFVTVYFEDIRYAQFVYENWYYIRISEDSGDLEGDVHECSFYEWQESEDTQVNAYCNLKLLPEAQARTLRQLYVPYIPEVSKIENIQKDKTVGAICEDTTFEGVVFYYVGAALCVGIVDREGTMTAFFDLGSRTSLNRYLVAQLPAAMKSRKAIKAELGATNSETPRTIFISHWHADHCNALGFFVDGGAFSNEDIEQNTEWYVPESRLPSFHMMKGVIPEEHFHIFGEGAYQPVSVNGNPNITVGKIDLQEDAHPHHQGIYVQLRLMSGNTVFLMGDTTYEGIPEEVRTREREGYHVLQACHHGGDYYLPPANQNAKTAQNYIPLPAEEAFIVYSADGIYHGHPDQFYKEQYQNKGYAKEQERCLHKIAQGGENTCFFD